MNTENIAPVKSSERYVILDALRGFAILGICMANYPEFSLYTFQSSETIKAMPTSGIDHVFRYLLYIFLCRRKILYFVFTAVRHWLFHYHR